MIKYFVNEDKKQVIGLLEGTRWDAYNKISKIIRDTDFCVVPNEKFMMPSKFRAVVVCDPSDEFNPEKGKEIAKKRILDRYYAALDKRVAKFKKTAQVFGSVISNTFTEFEKNT